MNQAISLEKQSVQLVGSDDTPSTVTNILITKLPKEDETDIHEHYELVVTVALADPSHKPAYLEVALFKNNNQLPLTTPPLLVLPTPPSLSDQTVINFRGDIDFTHTPDAGDEFQAVTKVVWVNVQQTTAAYYPKPD